jgi:hypothetical protein
MPYTVIAKAAGVPFTLATATEAVKKAVELMGQGMQGVSISDDQGRYYLAVDFHKLMSSTRK